jgi:hypothetical protein
MRSYPRYQFLATNFAVYFTELIAAGTIPSETVFDGAAQPSGTDRSRWTPPSTKSKRGEIHGAHSSGFMHFAFGLTWREADRSGSDMRWNHVMGLPAVIPG